MKLSDYNGIYKNEDVYILGSGTSLLWFDFKRLKNNPVIAINHSYKIHKPNVLIFNDAYFLKVEEKLENIVASNIPSLASQNTYLKETDQIKIFNFSNVITDNILAGLYGRMGTGFTALSLALISGAKRIFLVGYDYRGYTAGEVEKITGQKPDKEYFLHGTNGNHHLQNEKDSKLFTVKLKHFEPFQKYSNKIYNCNPYSAIPYFEVSA